MKVYYPPAQGSAYASPTGDETFTITYRLGPNDCAVCPKGASVDRQECVMGPGVVRYTRKPGMCSLEVLEGCRLDRYTRLLP
jgi:hypothetical protein